MKGHQVTIIDLAQKLNLSKSTVSRALTGHPSVHPDTRKAVLELAAEKSGWGRENVPARHGRGIALAAPFGSYLCVITDVEVTPQGEVILKRAVAVVDCGTVINPNTVEAQIEGGVIFGWSGALYSGITLTDGAVEQRNFNDYRVLRLNQTPPIEVYLIPSKETPGGIGETGTVMAMPSLANAIFAATGVRLRTLPIDRSALVQDKNALKSVLSAASPGSSTPGGVAEQPGILA